MSDWDTYGGGRQKIYGYDGSTERPLKVGTDGALTVGAAASGGWDVHFTEDLDETLEEIKASAGVWGGAHVVNMGTAVCYLQVFNAGTGAVTLGSTSPTQSFPIPTNGDTNGAGWTQNFGPQGLYYGTAITMAATKDWNGSAAPDANQVFLTAWYK